VQVQAFGDEAAVPATATGTARAGMMISDAIGKSLEKNPQTEIAAVPAYSKLMARVEQNTTRVRDLRDSLAGTVSDKDLADVSRRIEDIERAILVAIELSADEPTELDARIALTEVVARTQKLIMFMTELDVREQVTIEEVVPVVLTKDEMNTDRSNRTTKLTAAITRIEAAIEKVESPAIEEKLVAVNNQLAASLELQTTIEDYKAFVVESDESLELAADALLLVDQETTKTPEAPAAETTGTSTATTTDSAVPVATSSTPVATTSDPVATTTAENTQTEVDEQS